MKNYQLFITAAAFLAIGFILGMVVQQGIFQATLMKVAGNMDGVSIDVNINESKIVEATKNTFVPEMKELFNNSFMNNFNDCKPVPCECWEWGCALYCMECDDANVLEDES